MPKLNQKKPRKRNSRRTANIRDEKYKRQARHQWYIERKQGKHKGPCPL